MQLQKLIKNIKMRSAILSMLMVPLLLSCTTDKIKDSEWTGSRGPLGAVSFHFLTTQKTVLTPAQWLAKWNDLKHPLVCTSTDTFADLKALWEDCVTKGMCEYVTPGDQSKATNFFNNVESLKKGK